MERLISLVRQAVQTSLAQSTGTKFAASKVNVEVSSGQSAALALQVNAWMVKIMGKIFLL